MAQLGGPVLLKQGYMQVKGTFGWKRQYYRLLQVRFSNRVPPPSPLLSSAAPAQRSRPLEWPAGCADTAVSIH